MRSFLTGKYRFLAYVVLGCFGAVACALFFGAVMPMVVEDFTYLGHGGYEGGGFLGIQIGFLGAVLTVSLIERNRKQPKWMVHSSSYGLREPPTVWSSSACS